MITLGLYTVSHPGLNISNNSLFVKGLRVEFQISIIYESEQNSFLNCQIIRQTTERGYSGSGCSNILVSLAGQCDATDNVRA